MKEHQLFTYRLNKLFKPEKGRGGKVAMRLIDNDLKPKESKELLVQPHTAYGLTMVAQF